MGWLMFSGNTQCDILRLSSFCTVDKIRELLAPPPSPLHRLSLCYRVRFQRLGLLILLFFFCFLFRFTFWLTSYQVTLLFCTPISLRITKSLVGKTCPTRRQYILCLNRIKVFKATTYIPIQCSDRYTSEDVFVHYMVFAV